MAMSEMASRWCYAVIRYNARGLRYKGSPSTSWLIQRYHLLQSFIALHFPTAKFADSRLAQSRCKDTAVPSGVNAANLLLHRILSPLKDAQHHVPSKTTNSHPLNVNTRKTLNQLLCQRRRLSVLLQSLLEVSASALAANEVELSAFAGAGDLQTAWRTAVAVWVLFFDAGEMSLM